MQSILHNSSPAALLSAVEGNWLDYLRTFGCEPSVELRDDDTWFWFITNIPDGSFNAVMYTHVAPDQADAAIAEFLALRRSRGIPMGWLVGPSSRPSDLGQRLRERGLKHVATATPMLLDMGDLPAAWPAVPDLLIEPVENEAMLQEWISTEMIGFEASPAVARGLGAIRQSIGLGDDCGLRHYLACLHGAPVATATLLQGSGIAGIYDVATVPALRQRGIGSALTYAVLRAALAVGYRFATLQPSPQGINIYRQLGFRQICTFDVYG